MNYSKAVKVGKADEAAGSSKPNKKNNTKEEEDRARNMNRGRIEYYAKNNQAEAVKRSESRGSKRGSTSPLSGGDRHKIKIVK